MVTLPAGQSHVRSRRFEGRTGESHGSWPTFVRTSPPRLHQGFGTRAYFRNFITSLVCPTARGLRHNLFMARSSRRLEKDTRRWHADNDDRSVRKHVVYDALLSVRRRIAKRVTHPLQLLADIGSERGIDGERFRSHNHEVDELHAGRLHGQLGGKRQTSSSNFRDCFQLSSYS